MEEGRGGDASFEQLPTADGWREYFRRWIEFQRQSGEPQERLARYERLLNDLALDRVWMALAKDARSIGGPLILRPYECLLDVAVHACFPPGIIESPTKERVRPVLRALRILDRAWHDSPSLAGHLSNVIAAQTGRPLPLPTTRGQVKELVDVIERIDWTQYQGPLMPTTSKGRTAQRNWVALSLYLRDAIIPGRFARRHDGAIAELVEAAHPEWPAFSDGAKSVRELRAIGLGKRRMWEGWSS